MKSYRILPGAGVDSLAVVNEEERPLLPDEVRIAVRAVSLNYRDLMVAEGRYLAKAPRPVVPCSDAAGEVVEAGSEVRRFAVGDRVMGAFFPSWIEGDPAADKTADALGGACDGVLAEKITLREASCVPVPAHLNFVEAATLPCAGVTAWNALFVAHRLAPGSRVLLLGTGGVSTLALQLSRAAGLHPIITSSSDDKLARASALGAVATVNYRRTPEWQDEVLRLTQGQGVDLVFELGGTDTVQRSIAATRINGSLAIIGGVTGFGAQLELASLVGGAKRLTGIFVGSRRMLADLARFVEAHAIRPVVDKVYRFAEAKAAFTDLAAARHFGKLVIQL